MSDDERMDRAERIRKMRAGNRADDEDGTDAASDDDPAVDDDAESPVEDGETPDTDPEVDADTDPADAGDATDSTDAPATSETQSTGADTDTSRSEPADAQPSPAGGSTEDEDAVAAAQRAAETAAQMTGGGDGAKAGLVERTDDDSSESVDSVQGPAGVELPDQQLLEEAMEGNAADAADSATRGATLDDEETTQTVELVRVLEFALGEEYYCLDIEYVEEIVKRDSVTRVPNTPAHVEGVVDLRGQITTILDPTEMLDIDSDGAQNLIVVFDPDVFEEQGAVGWVVDEVRQVEPVAESDVNTPPVDGEYINGVVDRDGQSEFVIWIEPDDVLREATEEETD